MLHTHVHVHVTHLVMLYDIQNASTQLSTITTTVLHGPVHVGLGALAYVMVNKVLINVLAQSKYMYMYMHIHLSERSLNHLVPSHFAAPWAINLLNGLGYILCAFTCEKYTHRV